MKGERTRNGREKGKRREERRGEGGDWMDGWMGRRVHEKNERANESGLGDLWMLLCVWVVGACPAANIRRWVERGGDELERQV